MQLYSSEEAVNTVADDSLKLSTLPASNALSVRLRINGNVMRLDLRAGVEAQEPREHVVHEVQSLLISRSVVPMNDDFAEVGCLGEDAGHKESSLAKQCGKYGACAACFLGAKPGGVPNECDFDLADIFHG